MENIVSGATGLIHLIASIIALITGLFVLTITKGTKTHKQIGYVSFAKPKNDSTQYKN
jgi:uncharacterized membrane protein